MEKRVIDELKRSGSTNPIIEYAECGECGAELTAEDGMDMCWSCFDSQWAWEQNS